MFLYFCLLSFLLHPISLEAQNSITDLFYLPSAGEILVESEWSYHVKSFHANRDGNLYYAVSSSSSELLVSMIYGYQKGWTLGLSESYFLADKTSTQYGAASPTPDVKEVTQSNGLSDPLLFSKIRIAEDSWVFDLTVGLRPGLTKAGLKGSGGSSLNVRGEVGRKWSGFSLRGHLQYELFLDRTASFADSAAQKITFTGGNTLQSGIEFQLPWRKKIVSTFEISFQYIEAQSTLGKPNDSTTTWSPFGEWSLKNRLDYKISEDLWFEFLVGLSQKNGFSYQSGEITLDFSATQSTFAALSLSTLF